jgi:transposase
MIAHVVAGNKTVRAPIGLLQARALFADPLWDEDDPIRQEIDSRIPANHLVRHIESSVDQLDLTTLFRSYHGHGSRPVRPDLLLKVMLYELACGKPSPAEWFRDLRESESVQWLGRGIQPSRTVCYDFWDRVAPRVDVWNRQVLYAARAAGLLSAERAAQDGTTTEASASRHRMVNEETLVRRTQELDKAIVADQQALANEAPRWMAKHPDTRLQQRKRYQRAAAQMGQLQAENQQRRAYRRLDPRRIVVSTSDPDAVGSRDKLRVFRPLFNTQLLRDVDSPFVLAYQVYNRNHDSDRVMPLVERGLDLLGCKPRELLVDSAYVSHLDLAACELLGVTLYGPVGENDFSAVNGRQPQTNGKTKLPKRMFHWLPEEQVYLCPEGQRLEFKKQGSTKRHAQRQLRTEVFGCATEICAACRLRARCTPQSKTGRTITRIEHEELVEKLRVRMATPEGKQLYKLRGQTIEQPFADAKVHRGLRRFCRRGLGMAQAQIGAWMLCHNLLALRRLQDTPPLSIPATRTLLKMQC